MTSATVLLEDGLGREALAGMTAARGLYASLGFRETDPYTPNPYADVRYLGIDLSGPPR